MTAMDRMAAGKGDTVVVLVESNILGYFGNK
jgi:hypothetical protein